MSIACPVSEVPRSLLDVTHNKFNGMVKISSRGKGVKSFFREDISVVCILEGKGHFILLGSDGKLSG